MKSKSEKIIASKSLKVAYSGLLIAFGILLPQAFHVFGQSAGMTFLPIQIPILLAGLVLGPLYGGIVGIMVPVLSCILTGMPPVPKVYFMLFELSMYGIVTGLLIRKMNVYISLLGAMLAGRILYGLALAGGVYVLGIHAPFMNAAAFWGGIISGIPGMFIQIMVLPILYMVLKRGGFTFEQKIM